SGYYHENEQAAAAASFTKKTVSVADADALVAGFDDAWRALTDGRPGPVLFEVPVDVLRASVPDMLPALPAPPAPRGPAEGAIEERARLVGAWRRPLILAGGGVVSAGASAALTQLAGRLGAPVFHTANGKTALPSSHPLSAGLPWRRATSDLSNMSEQFSP